MQQVCHRDLKLENTLLDGSAAPRVKICDFGYSKVITITFYAPPPLKESTFQFVIDNRTLIYTLDAIWTRRLSIFLYIACSHSLQITIVYISGVLLTLFATSCLGFAVFSVAFPTKICCGHTSLYCTWSVIQERVWWKGNGEIQADSYA